MLLFWLKCSFAFLEGSKKKKALMMIEAAEVNHIPCHSNVFLQDMGLHLVTEAIFVLEQTRKE